MRVIGRHRALAAAILAGATPALAAVGPFSVRRASLPGDLAAASPAAVVTRAPFDDAAAFADPSNAFLVVTDATGARLAISVVRVPSLGVLRIGFDDGDPASAPVGAVASEVTLDRSSIPADGMTAATVTVRPVDDSGIPLGTGLAVAIDPSALWPGRVLGTVQDLGDGRYRALVVSTLPGLARVDIRVEGIVLATRPAIEYRPVESSGSLRDLAIAMLEDLAGDGGLLASAGLVDVRESIDRALVDLAAGPDRDDNALKGGIAEALATLSDPDLVAAVLGAARALAIDHLVIAEADCGACDAARHRPEKVCDAWDRLALGDREAAKTPPDGEAAAEAWAASVERSLQAEQSCR